VRNLRFFAVALLEMTERVPEITDIKKESLWLVTAQVLFTNSSTFKERTKAGSIGSAFSFYFSPAHFLVFSLTFLNLCIWHEKR
jgi:hypothetical protein